MQITTLNDILHWARGLFEQAELYYGHGTNNAWDEAVTLASFVLQLPPDVDASVGERVLLETEKKALIDLIKLRIEKRIPVPYLSHEAWFANLKFYVDERVLIPRSPLAELILKRFQPWIGDKLPLRILDLCTGGGCIAIACANVFKTAIVDAVDISPEALVVAERNVVLHQCEAQVSLYQSDLFLACVGKKYDIIISNPPYVATQEWQVLPPEYHQEPKLALEAGLEGLDVVKRILAEAPHYLKKGGLLFVEVGNAKATLQQQYPELPFIWLEFERGGDGVFLLTAEDMV